MAMVQTYWMHTGVTLLYSHAGSPHGNPELEFCFWKRGLTIAELNFLLFFFFLLLFVMGWQMVAPLYIIKSSGQDSILQWSKEFILGSSAAGHLPTSNLFCHGQKTVKSNIDPFYILVNFSLDILGYFSNLPCFSNNAGEAVYGVVFLLGLQIVWWSCKVNV